MRKVLLPGETEEPNFQAAVKPAGARTPWRAWFWIIGVSLVLSVWWWSQGPRTLPEKSASVQISPADQLVSLLAAQYQAEPQWAQGIPDQSPYSIELERALVRPDGKPTLLVGRVADIRLRGKQLIVEIEVEPDVHVPSLRLSLDCTPAIVDRLLQKGDRLSRYAAVALIESVSKARFRIDSHGYAVGEDEVETELEIETGEYFVARGQCVEIRPIPNT